MMCEKNIQVVRVSIREMLGMIMGRPTTLGKKANNMESVLSTLSYELVRGTGHALCAIYCVGAVVVDTDYQLIPTYRKKDSAEILLT